MLRDNALRFYSDHAYIITHNPIENSQYINKNDLLEAILKNREILITSIEAKCFGIMLCNFTVIPSILFLTSLLKMDNI